MHTEKTIATILAETKEEIQQFVSTRVDMLKAEMEQKVRTFKTAIPVILVAAALLLAGWISLTFAVIALLHSIFVPSAVCVVLGRADCCRRLPGSGRRRRIVCLRQNQSHRTHAQPHFDRAETGPGVDPEGSEGRVTEGVDVLEKRASDERLQLHNTVQELRHTVQERLDVKRNVRNHLGLVSAALAIAGLALGYVVTGVFTSD